MVHHTSRSADDDIGVLELDNLAFDGSASIDSADVDAMGVARQLLEFLTSLYSKLAGRTQQQHLSKATVQLRVNHLDGRNAKGGSFAGAGLGAADDVVSFQNQRDALRLNRSWFGKAHLDNSAGQCGSKR